MRASDNDAAHPQTGGDLGIFLAYPCGVRCMVYGVRCTLYTAEFTLFTIIQRLELRQPYALCSSISVAPFAAL
jgi:hypothetical protein